MFIIVDHNSPDTCIPPFDAYKVFDKYGFTYLEHEKLGTFNNWDDFNDALYDVYDKVSSAFIEDDTEGSVLYFIHEPKEGK